MTDSNRENQRASLSSKDVVQGPWWTPTVEVERLMGKCKAAVPGTVVIEARVLEGLCWDSLRWREERAKQPMRHDETSENPFEEENDTLRSALLHVLSSAQTGTSDKGVVISFAALKGVRDALASSPVEPTTELSRYRCMFCNRSFATVVVLDSHEETCQQDRAAVNGTGDV